MIAESYIDGSYNAKENKYGCGGFIDYNGERHIIKASSTNKDFAYMRNVAGELMGAIQAINKAIELKAKYINLYYDYLGIEKWALGEWKRNHKGTKEYYKFIQKANKNININFIKVKAHSMNEGNNIADKIAKEAVGII